MTTGNASAASRPVTSTTAAASTPLAAAAAFAPARVARVAAVVCAVVLVAGIAGIAGGIAHAGLFFVPALWCCSAERSGSGVSRPDPAWRCYR